MTDLTRDELNQIYKDVTPLDKRRLTMTALTADQLFEQSEKFWIDRESFDVNFRSLTQKEAAFEAGKFSNIAIQMIERYSYLPGTTDNRFKLEHILQSLTTAIRYASIADILDIKTTETETLIDLHKKVSDHLAEDNKKHENDYMDKCVSALGNRFN